MAASPRSIPLPDSPDRGRKPLDFGADGITGSLNADGRLIALNAPHPVHGYITLTSAAPFTEADRYHPARVRAYRAGLVHLDGFGPAFDSAPLKREAYLLADAIPRIRLTFADGGQAQITAFAVEGGALMICDCDGVTPHWRGELALMRCAYTQLTEGGPLPPAPVEAYILQRDDLITLTNPALGASALIAGLPDDAIHPTDSAQGRVSIDAAGKTGRTVVAFGLGVDISSAHRHALHMLVNDPDAQLDDALNVWAARWSALTEKHPDLSQPARRGLVYSAQMAIPDREGICLLTDHMLLPLSWNRDAYYAASALLHAWPDGTEIARRHLLWMFELAERVEGLWGRCYLANGRVKDHAFQLDQQIFPLLQLAEYVLHTGDRALLDRLAPHITPLLEQLHARRDSESALYPTDETPADDPIAYPYHLSSHILMWRTFHQCARVSIPGADWRALADEIHAAIHAHFTAERDGVALLAYATDGRGRHHFYHDANDVPLALAPAWGLFAPDDALWRNTVDFAFSDANDGGCYAGRLGSVHTRAPWPLGDLQERIIARITGDQPREDAAHARLLRVAQWDGALPEAYDAETGAVASRTWFAWPNALLAYIELTQLTPDLAR